jgi:hypothetical protein
MEEVTKNQRRAAKVINFGVMYGMSPKGLSDAAGMSFYEAKSFIDDYFRVRSPIKNYLDSVLEQAKTLGYVETLYCYVLGQDSGDGYINAKFMFKRYKNVGGSYQPLKATWPKWVNTNVLTNKVYDKLLEK